MLGSSDGWSAISSNSLLEKGFGWVGNENPTTEMYDFVRWTSGTHRATQKSQPRVEVSRAVQSFAIGKPGK